MPNIAGGKAIECLKVRRGSLSDRSSGVNVKSGPHKKLNRSSSEPQVWQRMNQRINDFSIKLDIRKNPDKYNLYPTKDLKTGQTLFTPKIIKNH